MVLYIMVGALLLISLMVIIFAIKTNVTGVRVMLAFITIIPWVLLLILLRDKIFK